jgi:hypothetical protein
VVEWADRTGPKKIAIDAEGAGMISCFIAFSFSYEPVMKRVRDLVQELGMTPVVFDTPDARPPMAVVREEIKNADLVVAILGPASFDEPVSGQPADWPRDEAVYADAQGKPVILVVHPGTKLPSSLEGQQTPIYFDFTNPASYADRVFHVVRRLLGAKNGLSLPAGVMPFRYKKAVFTHRFTRTGLLEYTIYHDIVARQSLAKLTHICDTGLDETESARIRLLNPEQIETQIVSSSGTHGHVLKIRLTDAAQHYQKYSVQIDPPLPAGSEIGYRRTFELENYFPLSWHELELRAGQVGFPDLFRRNGELLYGTSFEIYHETDLLVVSYEFNEGVPVQSCHAVALVDRSREMNSDESARISVEGMLTMSRPAELNSTTIRLSVPNPLIGHKYLLLYGLTAGG